MYHVRGSNVVTVYSDSGNMKYQAEKTRNWNPLTGNIMKYIIYPILKSGEKIPEVFGNPDGYTENEIVPALRGLLNETLEA